MNERADLMNEVVCLNDGFERLCTHEVGLQQPVDVQRLGRLDARARVHDLRVRVADVVVKEYLARDTHTEHIRDELGSDASIGL